MNYEELSAIAKPHIRKNDNIPSAVLAFFCKFEFSMIKYSVLWAGMATFWLSCLIVI